MSRQTVIGRALAPGPELLHQFGYAPEFPFNLILGKPISKPVGKLFSLQLQDDAVKKHELFLVHAPYFKM